mmetsp:Transcript_4485/g.12229  ORF Transcript_4485/g.12229 Transcript_4485/m.12229 type:complete len:618 (-) Transcript_4485:2455-4308(-)
MTTESRDNRAAFGVSVACTWRTNRCVLGSKCRGSFRAPRAPQRKAARMASGDRDEESRQQKREPWPVQRFLKDALFFTPIGKALNWRSELRVDSSKLTALVSPKRSSVSGRGTVLVTGATGGVGKRVVKLLLERGYRVHALVRSENRAQKILSTAGVDTAAEENLKLFVGDLHHVHPDFYDGVSAVISCTGVKVGPEDDTPDRSKYYQGVVFYPPKILEDTPHNVEHAGIANLVAQAERAGVGHASRASDEQSESSFSIVRFDQSDASAREAALRAWGVIDDVVMGGVSESKLRLSEDSQAALFAGMVSTNNRGGFASVRSASLETPLNLSRAGFKAFRLRVRGDGQRYKFIVRCDQKWDGVAYCYSFDTRRGEWMDVIVSFAHLRPVFRASTLRDGTTFRADSVHSFQLMLSKFEYDGDLNPSFQAGPFALELREIEAVTKSSAPTQTSSFETAETSPTHSAPRFIHVSSAGVTRVLRKNEFPDWDSQPPAVRMNDMLGRILEWKLAGEDVIRASALPHFIVRPCALTEEPPKGYSAMRVDQGDKMTGKISRDDVARVVVDALECDEVSNTTLELASGDTTRSGVHSLAELTSGLQRARSKEDERQHTFATFPYVP